MNPTSDFDFSESGDGFHLFELGWIFEPAAARERFLQIWQHQEIDGFMPHGLPMVPDAEIMPITLIPHKDTNVWGPLAIDLYLRETNDYGFLETEVPYQDGPPAPLADHLENGLRWPLKERLDNRIAPALLAPPYPGMVEHVGKLTLKSPGTGENGSIYSHAALFWSYALLHCGYADEG